MTIEWLVNRKIGIIRSRQNPAKSNKAIEELANSDFNVLVTIADYDFCISWKAGRGATLRHYQLTFSDYPKPGNWELLWLNEYLLYEIYHKKKIVIWFERAQVGKIVKRSINRLFKYENIGLSTFVKSRLALQKKRVKSIIKKTPSKLTHCRACKEKGCITRPDLICHVTPVADAQKIFKSGTLLSACRARKKSGKLLAREKRNWAGDPPDYFEYVMFTAGNCTAGDRLVMERSLDRSPTHKDLTKKFFPGVRFYFRKTDLIDHPGFVFDGYHGCKIKDMLELEPYLVAAIGPKADETDLLKAVSPELKKRLLFVDHTKYSDLWSWSHKVYEVAKKYYKKGRGNQPMNKNRLEKQVKFIVETDKLKQIYRHSVLMDGSRNENDAEHSWHLAIMAILFSEYALAKQMDILHVLKMVLIHDLVEIDAGDAFCYDEKARKDGAQREKGAAKRLFGILPPDQSREFKALWKEFEDRKTPEARFAASLDRLQPMLQNYKARGHAWKKHNVTSDMVWKRNKHIEEGSAVLWKYAKELIEESIEKGYLKPGK